MQLILGCENITEPVRWSEECNGMLEDVVMKRIRTVRVDHNGCWHVDLSHIALITPVTSSIRRSYCDRTLRYTPYRKILMVLRSYFDRNQRTKTNSTEQYNFVLVRVRTVKVRTDFYESGACCLGVTHNSPFRGAAFYQPLRF